MNIYSVPKECEDIPSDKSGVYTIYPSSQNHPVHVLCIMEKGKKWTVSICPLTMSNMDKQLDLFVKFCIFVFPYVYFKTFIFLDNLDISLIKIAN